MKSETDITKDATLVVRAWKKTCAIQWLRRPRFGDCGCLLAVLVACALTGCRTAQGPGEVGHYSVRVPQTPMFRYGPAQSFGPDFNLNQGQHVVMLKREYGYSRIMTDAGLTGYVATEDLAPAPPPVTAGNRANPRTPPRPPRGKGKPGVSPANQQILQNGPLFDPGELPPLPERDPLQKPDDDSAKPGLKFPKSKPGFRITLPPPEAKPDAKKEAP